MMVSGKSEEQLWRGDEVVSVSENFGIGELHRLVCRFGSTLEFRRVYGDTVKEVSYIVGSPTDVARVLEARGSADDKCAFFYLHEVSDLEGNDNIWSIEFEVSGDGCPVDGYVQVLWDPVTDDEVMRVERSSDGRFSAAEKPFLPNEDLDFLIYYYNESSIGDIVEFNYDSDDYLPEDLEPMFDDKPFYSSALALPSRFGKGAQVPDIPCFFVRRRD